MARRRAQVVLPVPGGIGVLHADYPAAHDHNRLVIVATAAGQAITAAAERLLGAHLEVDVLSEGALDAVGPDLVERGYARQDELLMGFRGRVGRPGGPVVALGLPERVAVAHRSWRGALPDADPDVARQLGQRISTLEPAAYSTFLAVRDDAGEVVARADLYLRDGIAQVEEVMTDVAARGSGLATRLVRAALERAQRAGAGLVFLHADADDWPQHFYRRLGFTDLGHTASFTRDRDQPPAPRLIGRRLR